MSVIPGAGISATRKSSLTKLQRTVLKRFHRSRRLHPLLPFQEITNFLHSNKVKPTTPVLDTQDRNQSSSMPPNLPGPFSRALLFSLPHARESKVSSTAKANAKSPPLASRLRNQFPTLGLTLPSKVYRAEALKAIPSVRL